MAEYVKTIYTFIVYSCNGVETVKAETSYKTISELKNEIEQAYKQKYNIKSSVIACLTDTKNIYSYN